ncbi:MAG: glycine cleavage system protein GcvH [Thermodesulfobacteriota bacterium]
MKEFNELILPEDLRFTQNHEWVRDEGETHKIGITDFAQDQLGDVVFVELPEVGTSLAQGEEFCTLESVKAVAEAYMPIGGEVVEINEALIDQPELINKDPYTQGWLIDIKPTNPAEFDKLMENVEYRNYIQGEE